MFVFSVVESARGIPGIGMMATYEVGDGCQTAATKGGKVGESGRAV